MNRQTISEDGDHLEQQHILVSYIPFWFVAFFIHTPIKTIKMSTIEQRFLNLLDSQLDISDASALDVDVKDLHINSMDTVSFLKAFNHEFGVDIAPADAAKMSKLRDFLDHV